VRIVDFSLSFLSVYTSPLSPNIQPAIDVSGVL
jgi:hypothetical protein